MKKYIYKIIAAAILLCLLTALVACGDEPGEETKPIDAHELFEWLRNEVEFAGELEDLGEDSALYFTDLPEGSEVALHKAEGRSADELALFTAADEAGVEALREVIEVHLDELKNQFMNYIPQEVPKIEDALTHEMGTSVILCITDDVKTAKQIIKAAEQGETRVQTEKSDKTKVPETEPQTDTLPVTEAQTTAPETAPLTTPPVTQASPPVTTAPPETQAPIVSDPILVPPDISRHPVTNQNYPAIYSATGAYYKYSSGVIRVDDAAYEVYTYNPTAAAKYINIINNAAALIGDSARIYNIIIPTAFGVALPDDIRAIYPNYSDQGESLAAIYSMIDDRVVKVNCYDNLMRHRNEYLYFRTDFHWNGRAAYYAYETFCAAKGVTPYNLYQRKYSSFGGFLGALYWNNCSQDPVLAQRPDAVEAFYPFSDTASMKMTDKNGYMIDWKIIQDVSSWKAGSKYSTFAGADSSFAIFTNPAVTDGSVCVVIKESYGNALMPYLVDHYSTVYEIDYRYWSGSLVNFVRDYGVQDVIFANNLMMTQSNYLLGKLSGIIGS